MARSIFIILLSFAIAFEIASPSIAKKAGRDTSTSGESTRYAGECDHRFGGHRHDREASGYQHRENVHHEFDTHRHEFEANEIRHSGGHR